MIRDLLSSESSNEGREAVRLTEGLALGMIT
jgi:hypothetical protein